MYTYLRHTRFNNKLTHQTINFLIVNYILPVVNIDTSVFMYNYHDDRVEPSIVISIMLLVIILFIYDQIITNFADGCSSYITVIIDNFGGTCVIFTLHTFESFVFTVIFVVVLLKNTRQIRPCLVVKMSIFVFKFVALKYSISTMLNIL